MLLKESSRKNILLGMVIFIIIGFIIAKVIAKGQDEEFHKNEITYEQVMQLYMDGKYEEAYPYIIELLETQPNSEVVNYTGGLISALNEDYLKASILLQKTLDINPHKVEDPIFMLQLGEIFYKAERYEDAEQVLSHCQDVGWIPDEIPNYQEKVTELLNAIENLK